MTTPRVTFYHAPHSRSGGTRALLEELGVEYDMHVLNFGKNEQRQPGYMAVNPMGKVPAIRHGGAVVTEQVAIYIYLADMFAPAGLAPGLTDARRGPYLRWMVFYAACFEPAMVDKAMKREAGAAMMSPYGDYDTVVSTLTAQLEMGPYMLGADFSALDVLWGTALQWMTAFGLLAATPVITAYIERVTTRPAFVRAKEKDAALAAQQKKPS
jgi:glutathione S-transferase